MKILAFVDTHGNIKNLKKIRERAIRDRVDLLICAGDVSNWGMDLKNLILVFKNLGTPLIIIPGNHEDEIEMEKICSDLDFVICLHKKIYKLNEYMFFGYGGGGFSLRDEEFEMLTEKFKKTLKEKNKKIVLITHAPPYKTELDRLDHIGHAGCQSIKEFIEEFKPVLNICGHLHETSGNTDKIGKTIIVNPGDKGKIINI